MTASYGVLYDTNANILTYNLTDLGIVLDSNWRIGYSAYCANDVISGTNPVPEPATLFLIGSGLLGLTGFRRNKSKRNSK